MQNTKTFRLFISSTFNDFRREREVLQTKVFPHVKEYCSKKGYTFQPIDLRWGINEEAQLDQKTLKLCLDEVRSCKSYPYPNFLLMLGDRYGWIPLPYTVASQEFEEILDYVDADEKKLLLEWYREDFNQLPASYILKERSGEYADFSKWGEVENAIRSIFQKTVKHTSLNEAQQRKYFLSATEAEIEEGIIPYINPTAHQQKLLENNPKLEKVDTEHIFGFFRDMEVESKSSDKFMGDDTQKAQGLKQRVKNELINENILQSHTIQRDEESLEEQYLIEFEQKIVSFLESKVDGQIAKEQDFTSLEVELQAQAYFAKQKRHNFMGQKELLGTIASYIKGDGEQALIVYGASGRGKSSLMSEAIKQAETDSSRKILYRFVGATPHSGSSREILTSFFDELGIDARSKWAKGQGNDSLIGNLEHNQETFEQFSERIYDKIINIKEDVAIFIDAVDQLRHNDQFLWLPSKLPANVTIVISALDDERYSKDSRYFQTLKEKSKNLHEIPVFGEAVKLLYTLLKNESRTIQKYQEEYFLKQYASSASPLYISVAVQEMKHWKSFDAVGGDKSTLDGKMQDLADTQQGIIQEYINNLSDFYHHDKALVQKVLGYIYASRDGLSESEILQLLSVDEMFVKQIAPDTWHENKSGGLPMVIWTRLYAHLKPFLSQKTQDGEELLYFFHREFEEIISGSEYIKQGEMNKKLIASVQEFIFKTQHNDFENNRWGKLLYQVAMNYFINFNNEKYIFSLFKTINVSVVEDWYSEFISFAIMYDIKRFSNEDKLFYLKTSYNICLADYRLQPSRTYKAHMCGYFLHKISRYETIIDIKIDMLERCIIFFKTSRHSQSQPNPLNWLIAIIEVYTDLGEIFEEKDNINESIRYYQEALNLFYKYEQQYEVIDMGFYFFFFNSFADLLLDNEREDQAIKMEEEAFERFIKNFNTNQTDFGRDFDLEDQANALYDVYTKTKCKTQKINPSKEVMKAYREKHYKYGNITGQGYMGSIENYLAKNNIVNLSELEYLTNELDNLFDVSYGSYLYKSTLELIIKQYIFLRNINLTGALYGSTFDKNSIEEYIRILNNIAKIYFDLKQIEKAIQMAEECHRLLAERYYINPKKWQKYYISIMENLGKYYSEADNNRKAKELRNKIDKILLET